MMGMFRPTRRSDRMFQSVVRRHVNIRDDNVREDRLSFNEGFSAVCRLGRCEATVFQSCGQGQPDQGFVIDNENERSA
jgi:hypothetical protein